MSDKAGAVDPESGAPGPFVRLAVLGMTPNPRLVLGAASAPVVAAWSSITAASPDASPDRHLEDRIGLLLEHQGVRPCDPRERSRTEPHDGRARRLGAQDARCPLQRRPQVPRALPHRTEHVLGTHGACPSLPT